MCLNWIFLQLKGQVLFSLMGVTVDSHVPFSDCLALENKYSNENSKGNSGEGGGCPLRNSLFVILFFFFTIYTNKHRSQNTFFLKLLIVYNLILDIFKVKCYVLKLVSCSLILKFDICSPILKRNGIASPKSTIQDFNIKNVP